MSSLTPAREKYKREITLLSHGYSAPKAFPDGKVTVYPWDPETDAWIVEKIQKSGNNATNFLWDLCARQCDLNGCPIDQVVVGDVTTILLVARGITNKNVVNLKVKCPQCGLEFQENIQVPDHLGKIGEKTSDYPGFDTITLAECKDIIKIRPLVVGDMKKIDGRSSTDKAMITDRILRILVPVVSINDTAPDTFAELTAWYAALHPLDKQQLQDKEDELYPHLDQNIKLVCNREDCKHTFTHALTFNQEFFR